MPLTIPHLAEGADDAWRLIGDGALEAARESLAQGRAAVEGAVPIKAWRTR
ncbi:MULTISPECIES: hypothetical protein [unclassified Bradyrhizobium]|uniref:hypothetical protein n=1 Tax=unclassified Bradyrhizobium TaxID=2631580 RepID=UPI0015A65866|nr:MULTISPECIES: hypothetical protein [unclassified Bradyrhizobium]MBB4381726.1 hypothetical protein [Bradyrhizobium sp. SBR1B]